jgi:hypothetical protein
MLGGAFAGRGVQGLAGVMTVAEHLAGGGGVLWGEDEKCGTLGADSSQVPSRPADVEFIMLIYPIY